MYLTKILSTLTFLFLSQLCPGLSYAMTHNNIIVPGSAAVHIVLNGDVPDSLEASLIVADLFDEPFFNSTYRFVKEQDTLSCQIPMDVREALAGLIVETPVRRFSAGMIELSQDSPLYMTADFAPDGSVTYTKSNNTGFNSSDLGPTPENQGLILSDILMRFTSYHLGISDDEPEISASDFISWPTIREKFDSLYYVQKRFALNGRDIPEAAYPWLENNLKIFFAANWLMNYEERARRTFGATGPIDVPPLEYYSFLNEIDYSQEILNHPTMFGPYYLFKKILQKLPIDIQPIKETPVRQWQTDVSNKLSAVIDKPAAMLLDLLSASSYIMQINDLNQPLTPVQTTNITEGYTNGLDHIIKKRNNSLLHRLSIQTTLHNLSTDSFELKKFIDEKYPGRPVAVDIWNTWCSPCIAAHRETETIRESAGSENTVFLFICDESSPDDTWQKLATQIRGEQIRISKHAAESLGYKYDITAVPTYLFFDRKHTLIHKVTGFPGIQDYKVWIEKISRY